MLIIAAFSFILITALSLFVARYRKHLRKAVIRRSRETWAISIYEGSSPFELHPPADIKNPVITAEDVTDIKARFVADPFMIKGQNGYYLFFEVLNNKRNIGEIGYAFSSDGQKWQYRNIIIRERFHLSYPYVFYWEDNYYLIPECKNSGGVQLYRATNFPEQWKRIGTLINKKNSNSAIIDPSIIRHGNLWYLFSYGKNKSLYLFTSETLPGPWKEHPKSPLVTESSQYARPGGRVIDYEGFIYRYAQDEIPLYGSRVWAFRITELTEKTYREEPVSDQPIVQPGKEWWNRDGMHHVDPHKNFSGGWFAFVDGFSVKHTEPGRKK
jgi:hypothetical protein